jgi:hypothetical protein
MSDVEIISVDNTKTEMNDFNRTVKKVVIPLSVIAIFIKLILSLYKISPLFANGINTDMKKGNKKSKSVLFTRIKKLGLKNMAIKTFNIKYSSKI